MSSHTHCFVAALKNLDSLCCFRAQQLLSSLVEMLLLTTILVWSGLVWFGNLQLAYTSTFILCSGPHGRHDHIFMSHNSEL
jgi:hypothetical protein